MPVFEYKCENCKKDFEILILSEKEVPFCPFCKSKNLKKKVSNFQNKGKGSCSISPSGFS